MSGPKYRSPRTVFVQKNAQLYEVRRVFRRIKGAKPQKFSLVAEVKSRAHLFDYALKMFLLLLATKGLDGVVKTLNFKRRKAGGSNAFTGYWQWSHVFILIIFELAGKDGRGKHEGKDVLDRYERISKSLHEILQILSDEELIKIFPGGLEKLEKQLSGSALLKRRDQARKVLADNGIAQLQCEYSPSVCIRTFRALSSKSDRSSLDQDIVDFLGDIRKSGYFVSETESVSASVKIGLDLRWASTGKDKPRRRVKRIRLFGPGEVGLVPRFGDVILGWTRFVYLK